MWLYSLLYKKKKTEGSCYKGKWSSFTLETLNPSGEHKTGSFVFIASGTKAIYPTNPLKYWPMAVFWGHLRMKLYTENTVPIL